MNQHDLEALERRIQSLEARLDGPVIYLARELRAMLDVVRVSYASGITQAGKILEFMLTEVYKQRCQPPADRQEIPGLSRLIGKLTRMEGLIPPELVPHLDHLRTARNRYTHWPPLRPNEDDVAIYLRMACRIADWYVSDYLKRPAPAEQDGPLGDNPYPGLAPFGVDDAPRFFGRQAETRALIKRLEGRPITLLVAPSGGGKTSLIQAGVLPRLGARPNWRVCTIQPTHRLFYDLAKVLADIKGGDELQRARWIKEIEHGAVANELDLAALADQLVTDGGRLVLVVDRFEALFTDPEITAKLRERFLALLEGVHGDSRGLPLAVALALRMDLLERAMVQPRLCEVINTGGALYLLPPIEANPNTAAQLIEAPAKGAGAYFEPLLVERILDDLRPGSSGGSEIVLPLLQFTLQALWERREGRVLTHRAYEALGGVRKALAHYADGIIDDPKRFSDAERVTLREILAQLVNPGPDGKDTRQVVRSSQLGDERWALIDRLADARLVTTTSVAGKGPGEATAELIHESLIHHWGKLRQWLGEQREFRLWQNGLRQRMREWQEAHHEDSALLYGRVLGIARERLEQQGELLAESERAFIAESVRAEEAKIARDRRQRLRLRLLFRSALAVGAVALFFAAAASVMWHRADESAADAQRQRLSAERQSYSAHMNLAWQAWHQRDLGRVIDLLGSQREQVALHGFAWDYLNALVAAEPETLRGHTGQIRAMALDPGSGTVATAGWDGTVVMWDLEKRTQRSLMHSDKALFSVAVSAGAQRVAAGGFDGDILVWTARDETLRRFEAHPDAAVTGLAFDEQGAVLASVGDDGRVRLWDEALRLVADFRRKKSTRLHAVEFLAPDRLLIGAEDGLVSLWNWKTGTAVEALLTHRGPVRDLALARGAPLLAVAAGDEATEHEVQVWRTIDWQPAQPPLRGLDQRPYAVAISEQGDRLAVGLANGEILVQDLRTGDRLSFQAHSRRVTALAFTADGARLVSASGDKTARTWSLSELLGDPEPQTFATRWMDDLDRVLEHPEAVKALATTADGRRLAAAGGSTVTLWALTSAEEPKHFELPAGLEARVLAFAPGDEMLAVGTGAAVDDPGEILLFDAKHGALRRRLTGHTGWVSGIAFDGSGRVLFSASKDRTVRAWDLASGKPIGVGRGHRRRITAIAVAPSGDRIATVSHDGRLLIRSASAALDDVLLDLGRPRILASGLAFSRDGKRLAVSSWDHTAALVELEHLGRPPVLLQGHADGVSAIDFGPKGQVVATAGLDKQLRLWSVRTGAPVATLNGHKAAVNCVVFDPEGRWLASGDESGRVIIRFARALQSAEPALR